MGALAHNAAFVQHKDLLGLHDGGYALRYDDDGGISSGLGQRLTECRIGFIIQRREGIVKEIDFRPCAMGA